MKKKFESVKESSDRGRDIDDKGVSNAKLHFALAIANVTNSFHLVSELILGQLNANLDTVEILLVDVTGADGLHDGLAD